MVELHPPRIIKYGTDIHYQVELGENSDAPSGLEDLQVEFQLRTILEEAWGEIDHKYRYVCSRSGVTLPDYIQRGFYNLSVYLQVAALQAEDLCLLAETQGLKTNAKIEGRSATPLVDEPVGISIGETEASQKPLTPSLEMYLEEILGFKITVRTLNYVERRLDEVVSQKNLTKYFRRCLQKIGYLNLRQFLVKLLIL